jgi:hypothetical protein
MKPLKKMKNKAIIVIIFFLPILIYSCIGYNCDKLPEKFSDYEEAILTIKKAHFKVEGSVNASKSSWIKGASYYSCDGNFGFLIVKTEKEEYIYSNIPLIIWQEFKQAESFGAYYNQNIKYKYIFNLNP